MIHVRENLNSFASALLFLGVVLLMGGGSQLHPAPPQITNLSDSALPVNGRLLLFGTDFGTGADSEVTIDGLPADATVWTPTEIHVRVPKAASVGAVDVQITTPEGAFRVTWPGLDESGQPPAPPIG